MKNAFTSSMPNAFVELEHPDFKSTEQLKYLVISAQGKTYWKQDYIYTTLATKDLKTNNYTLHISDTMYAHASDVESIHDIVGVCANMKYSKQGCKYVIYSKNKSAIDIKTLLELKITIDDAIYEPVLVTIDDNGIYICIRKFVMVSNDKSLAVDYLIGELFTGLYYYEASQQ